MAKKIHCVRVLHWLAGAADAAGSVVILGCSLRAAVGFSGPVAAAAVAAATVSEVGLRRCRTIAGGI